MNLNNTISPRNLHLKLLLDLKNNYERISGEHHPNPFDLLRKANGKPILFVYSRHDPQVGSSLLHTLPIAQYEDLDLTYRIEGTAIGYFVPKDTSQ